MKYAISSVGPACLLLAAMAALLPGQAFGEASWRQPWQVKQCTGIGTRQYSSQLMNIPWGQDWQTYCNAMSADINGQHFDRPTRCIPNAGMWGEFDQVSDASCLPRWDVFTPGACKADGRLYSGRLQNITGDWMAACNATPATVAGASFSPPALACLDRGVGGMWGEVVVADVACSPLQFDGTITFDDDTTPTRAFVSGTVEVWACASNVGGACSWSKIASTSTDAQGRYSVAVAGNRELADQYTIRVVGENPSAYIFAQDTLNVFFADLGSPRVVTAAQRRLTFDRRFLSAGSDRYISMHLNGVQKLLDALPFVLQFRDPTEGDTMGKVAVSPSISNRLDPPVVYTNLGIIHLHPDRLFTSDPDETLLHEYGHYVQERIGSYALDPRQHDGCAITDPNYAWFEGFPTFFWRAVRLLNAAHYRAPNSLEVPRSNLTGPVSCPSATSPESVEFVVSDILFLLMNDGTNSCGGNASCLQSLWNDRLKLILGIVDKEFDYDIPGAKTLDRFRISWIDRGGSRAYIDAVYAKFGIAAASPPVTPRAACLARCIDQFRACIADAHSRAERFACSTENRACTSACPR